MSRSVRFIIILLSSAIGLLALAVLVLSRNVEERLSRTYDVPAISLDAASDLESLEHGRHLVTAVYFCDLCHGEDLGGLSYFDDPLSGRIGASNLTSGAGGVGSEFSEADWDRAVRHGVDEDGRPLVGMPSNSYAGISDSDLEAMIGYLRSLPEVDNPLPERDIGPLYKLSILSDPSQIPAEVIEHSGARQPAPESGVTVDYGRYLTRACTICHGEDLAGGPGAGAGLDLTRRGELANWSQETFIRAMRTGETPRNYQLDPELMPWESVGKMTDDELKAMWLYLQSLPPKEYGNR